MIAYQVGDVVLHQPPRGSQRLVRVTQRQDTLIGDGQFCGRVLCDCGAEPMLPVFAAGFDSEIVAVQAALPLMRLDALENRVSIVSEGVERAR